MIRVTVFTLAVFASLQPAHAQDRAALRNACRDDVAKLCPGVKPGGGRVAACFKEKREDLSQDCRAALQQANASRRKN